MVTQAMEVVERADRPQTKEQLLAHIYTIQDVKQNIMKKDVHYGTIPGCAKPSLYKAGAELLFTTFGIAVVPTVEDLSTREEARFRVTATARTIKGGMLLGSALGEASSNEEKYQWRAVVCTQEFEATAEDQKRTKWRKSRDSVYSVQQVRTNVADCRNTALAMADKRATVALCRRVLSASDVFEMGLEDIPEEMRETLAAEAQQSERPSLPTEVQRKVPVQAPAQQVQDPTPVQAPVQQQTRWTPPAPTAPTGQPYNSSIVTAPQARRFAAKWRIHKKTEGQVQAYLQSLGLNVQTDGSDMPRSVYDAACLWADAE